MILLLHYYIITIILYYYKSAIKMLTKLGVIKKNAFYKQHEIHDFLISMTSR